MPVATKGKEYEMNSSKAVASQVASSFQLSPGRPHWLLVLTRVGGRVLLYGLLIILSLSFALPLLWMVSTSLKIDSQVYHVPPIWIPNPIRFRNYLEIWLRAPFGTYFLNSAMYGLSTALGTLISSTVVAYGFSRLHWRGRDALFFLCIATMMVPFQVRMIPLYILFKNVGWLNSYLPLIVPTFFANAYFVFLLRQFFMTIPAELSEAAYIDGCSEAGIFWRIVLPLSTPILAVVALLQLMSAWNEYLGPLIYLNRENLFPLALGLEQMRANFAEELMWPYLMAASTIMIAPIVVIFFAAQRTFVESVTITGIKG